MKIAIKPKNKQTNKQPKTATTFTFYHKRLPQLGQFTVNFGTTTVLWKHLLIKNTKLCPHERFDMDDQP